MFAWHDGHDLTLERPSLWAWPLVIIRALLIAITIFGLMVPLFICRLCGFDSIGQQIVRLACLICLRIAGVKTKITGTPLRGHGLVVANHSSWLDIFSMHSAMGVYFVSKASVYSWPLIGQIARSTGTVFIERRTSHAAKHKNIFMDRIERGHRLMFFPEGTSTDGRRVLKFRSSLFAALFEQNSKTPMWVQPVTLNYVAPNQERVDFYGWWGEMNFFDHFTLILSRIRHGHIDMIFHDPLNVQDYKDRKEIAAAAETIVRAGLSAD